MLIKQNLNTTPTRTRVNTLAAAVITAGLVFSAIPANAYIPRDHKVSIRVNPVDLETNAGIQRVYQYMTQEAKLACATKSRPTLVHKKMSERCAADLLDDFVQDLNNAKVSELHKRQISA